MTSRRTGSLHLSHHSDHRKLHYRVTVMGAAGVGKSCIISQFLYDTFIAEYSETIEELHRGEFEINGMELTLDILDTSGSHIFPAMRKLAIANSDAFILVYSVEDMSSFDAIKAMREEINAEKKRENVPIVVVGNKCDISKTDHIVERETTETIVEVEWGNGYVEVSAKDNLNIVGIFKEILRQCNSTYSLSPAVKRRRASTSALSQHVSQMKEPKRHSCTIS